MTYTHTLSSFTLSRSDGTQYRFVPHNSGGAQGTYMRTDRPDLTIGWDPAWGWCARDGQTGRLAGVSFDLPAALQGPQPPVGRWVSAKGCKSYLYELRYD